MKTKYTIAIIVILTLVLILLTCGESIVNQATFFPEKGTVIDLERLPPSIKHYYIETPDGEQLSAFYVPRLDADKSLLYFHGNAGNASQRIQLAVDLAKLKSNVLLIDYRGYGLSSGSPSEAGIYIDGRAALDFLINEVQVDTNTIFLYGRSLGSAVAVEISKDMTFAGMILATPISSGANVAANTGLESASSIIGNPFNNLAKIPDFTAPILIIHGDLDQVLPITMGRALEQAATAPVRFVEVPGAGHNDIIVRNKRRFYSEINTFCADVLADKF